VRNYFFGKRTGGEEDPEDEPARGVTAKDILTAKALNEPAQKPTKAQPTLEEPKAEADAVDGRMKEQGPKQGLKPEVVPAKETPAEPKLASIYNLPETALKGWLGEQARKLEVPLEYAYPAVCTVFCTRLHNRGTVRPTLYTALVGPVHCGKSVAIDRAVEIMGYGGEDDTVVTTTPASDRGMALLFPAKRKVAGERASGIKEGEEVLPLRPRLLACDELKDLLNKTTITNSSLPQTLCTLFYKDQAGSADKTGEHKARVQLSILGGLKATNPDDFAQTFGKSTSDGLYDRFLFCVNPGPAWKFSRWTQRPETLPDPETTMDDLVDDLDPEKPRPPRHHWEPVPFRKATVPAITQEATERLAKWKDEYPGNDRLAEIGERLMYITAAADQQAETNTDDIEAAIQVIDWQLVIRQHYKALLGEGKDAMAMNAILNLLEKHRGEWVVWSKAALLNNWYRKYDTSLPRAREALSKGGITVEEEVNVGDEDRPQWRKTGRLMMPKEESAQAD